MGRDHPVTRETRSFSSPTRTPLVPSACCGTRARGPQDDLRGKKAELLWSRGPQKAPAGSSDAGAAAEPVSAARAVRDAVAEMIQLPRVSYPSSILPPSVLPEPQRFPDSKLDFVSQYLANLKFK